LRSISTTSHAEHEAAPASISSVGEKPVGGRPASSGAAGALIWSV
jgi:hypothetical protein